MLTAPPLEPLGRMGDFDSSKDPTFNTTIKNRLQPMACNHYPEKRSHKRMQKGEK